MRGVAVLQMLAIIIGAILIGIHFNSIVLGFVVFFLGYGIMPYVR